MNDERLLIDEALVRCLITTQIPQWKDFRVRLVPVGGWDNRTFRLGDRMLVRMPSAAQYAGAVEKEHRWLPILAPLLPLQIPVPLVMGQPGEGYPYRWSIYRWIEGETAASVHIDDLNTFAFDLAQFLIALQSIDPTHGPLPGAHNFSRGGALTFYDSQTRQAIELLKEEIDAKAAMEVWQSALATQWQRSSVWVHGDISAGNLLVQDGRLSAVIDFGGLAIGDPACDLAIAWKIFSGESRKVYLETLQLDAGTCARGRGWALWKALIVASGIVASNAVEASQARPVIDEVLRDYTS